MTYFFFQDRDQGPPKTYQCLHCTKEVRVSASSSSNLKAHRDGSTQAGKSDHGCPGQAKAIEFGIKLPPEVFEKKSTCSSNNITENCIILPSSKA